VIARPQLLLLDEPFGGLDPINVEAVRQVLLELVRGGTTVLFSTHDMSAAESMCDWILMIYKGRKVLDGTLREIQRQHGGDVLRVRLEWSDGSDRRLRDLPGVVKVADLGNMQELGLAAGADRQHILQLLMQRGKVEHFELTHPSLREIFLQIAGGPDRASPSGDQS
jgi:ABC-2 type transport system ATP-binding protein